MTKLFLGLLKQNSRSYIMNVSSMAAFFHLPKKHVYGATKSFVYSLSKSLRRELKGDHVHVCVLCPGGMNTNLPVTLMNKNGSWISRMSVMNPEDVGPIAIDGMLKGKEVIIPGKVNRIFILLDKLLPASIKNFLMRNAMDRQAHKNSLMRYLSPEPVVNRAAEIIQ